MKVLTVFLFVFHLSSWSFNCGKEEKAYLEANEKLKLTQAAMNKAIAEWNSIRKASVKCARVIAKLNKTDARRKEAFDELQETGSMGYSRNDRVQAEYERAEAEYERAREEHDELEDEISSIFQDIENCNESSSEYKEARSKNRKARGDFNKVVMEEKTALQELEDCKQIKEW